MKLVFCVLVASLIIITQVPSSSTLSCVTEVCVCLFSLSFPPEGEDCVCSGVFHMKGIFVLFCFKNKWMYMPLYICKPKKRNLHLEQKVMRLRVGSNWQSSLSYRWILPLWQFTCAHWAELLPKSSSWNFRQFYISWAQLEAEDWDSDLTLWEASIAWSQDICRDWLGDIPWHCRLTISGSGPVLAKCKLWSCYKIVFSFRILWIFESPRRQSLTHCGNTLANHYQIPSRSWHLISDRLYHSTVSAQRVPWSCYGKM